MAKDNLSDIDHSFHQFRFHIDATKELFALVKQHVELAHDLYEEMEIARKGWEEERARIDWQDIGKKPDPNRLQEQEQS